MNEREKNFREIYRYEERQVRNNQNHSTRKSSTTNIKGINRTKSRGKKYKSKRLKEKLVALALAGAVVFGGTKIVNGFRTDTVKGMKEIQENNITAQDLGMSEQEFEEAQNLYNKVKGKDLSKMSNEELAVLYSEIAETQLEILKNKVGNIIGKETYNFQIIPKTMEGGILTPVRIMDSDGQKCIGTIESDTIDKYLQNVSDGRKSYEQMLNGDIDRKKVEKGIQKNIECLGEATSICFYRDSNKKENKLNTYFLEDTRQENKNNNIEKDFKDAR